MLARCGFAAIVLSMAVVVYRYDLVQSGRYEKYLPTEAHEKDAVQNSRSGKRTPGDAPQPQPPNNSRVSEDMTANNMQGDEGPDKGAFISTASIVERDRRKSAELYHQYKSTLQTDGDEGRDDGSFAPGAFISAASIVERDRRKSAELYHQYKSYKSTLQTDSDEGRDDGLFAPRGESDTQDESAMNANDTDELAPLLDTSATSTSEKDGRKNTPKGDEGFLTSADSALQKESGTTPGQRGSRGGGASTSAHRSSQQPFPDFPSYMNEDDNSQRGHSSRSQGGHQGATRTSAHGSSQQPPASGQPRGHEGKTRVEAMKKAPVRGQARVNPDNNTPKATPHQILNSGHGTLHTDLRPGEMTAAQLAAANNEYHQTTRAAGIAHRNRGRS